MELDNDNYHHQVQLSCIQFLVTSIMDVGTGGQKGERTPHFSKAREQCPFSCNFVALLENLEDAKTDRNVNVSGDFRRPKCHNSPSEHASRHSYLI